MPGKCKTVVLYDFPQRGTIETPLIVGIFHSPKAVSYTHLGLRQDYQFGQHYDSGGLKAGNAGLPE